MLPKSGILPITECDSYKNVWDELAILERALELAICDQPCEDFKETMKMKDNRIAILELAWSLLKQDVEDGTLASFDMLNFEPDYYIQQAERELKERDGNE